MTTKTLRRTIPSVMNTPLVLPSAELTDLEKQILMIPGLVVWLEADINVRPLGGWRWMMRNKLAPVFPMERYPPKLVTSTNGKVGLQMGFGDTRYTSTERGALITPDDPAFSDAGFCMMCVVEIPLASESATQGGYIFSSSGANVTSTPRVIISRASGRPSFTAGGVAVNNVSPAFDQRDNVSHHIAAIHDIAGGFIRCEVDRSRSVGQTNGATVPTPLKDRRLIIGRFGYGGASDQPWYGRMKSIIHLDRPGTSADRELIRGYQAAKWGSPLV